MAFAPDIERRRRRDEIEDKEKRKELAKLKKLTLKERVERLEAWVYNYKPEYVSPPRY